MIASTLLAIPFVPVFYVVTQRLTEKRSGSKKESVTEDKT
jgi:hydrophobic/amphiphilic exporter-1 (mainly G- bacteria), HAE1 family